MNFRGSQSILERGYGSQYRLPQYMGEFPDLPSFASVTNSIAKPTVDTSSTNANIRALVLDDQDLINVEDPSMMLLVKLKDMNSMSNMYVISRNEGFTELKIHRVGGLWIWIQFPSSSSTDNFQTNASLKSIYSCIKTATPSFKVDEYMIWIEICRICISTNSHNFVSERVLAEVHRVNYDVHVHELGTWNINIIDETLDSSEKLDVNGNYLADLNDLNDLKETINELASNKIQHLISKENMDQEDDIIKVSPEIAVSSDLSRPLGIGGNTVGDCYMINIYGPQDSLAKAILWNRIGDFMHQHAGKSIIFGDMNVVRNENERSDSLFSRQDADNFNSFIDNSGLIDLPLGGRLFTRMNKAGTKLSKLDRFLISEEVVEGLLNVCVTAIDRLWSDHNLILLHVSKSDFGPTPFKLFYSCLLRDSFDEVSIVEKIEAVSTNDDDRDSRINFLQEVDILDTFESFDLFQKARVKWDIEDEVKNVVWDCGSSKASGPDGFSFAFVKKYYDYIKVDIMKYVNIFLDTGSLPHGSNSSFFTLISKVDFEKAFDSVSWKYLNFVLLNLGFGSKWRSWIRACLSSSRASVLVNANVYGIEVSDVNVFSMASNPGCASGSFPFTYLGLPIGSNISLTSSWQESGFDNNGCIYNVGCGTRIRFWKDTWVGDSLFYIRYNRLYRLENEKDCLIIDHIDHGQWRWNWSRPNLGAQNSVDLLDMLFEISSAEINEVEDTCAWSLHTDGTFSVKDARCIIDSKMLPSLAPSTIWDKNIPRKAISCPSCNGNVESSNHIFFECKIAKDIWMHVLKWCDISFPPFTSYEHWKGWFTSWQVVKEKSRCLSVIFSSSLWWLWRYRNNVTFRSHLIRKSDILDNIRLSSYSWLHHRGHMISNWIDWLKSLMLLSSNGLG
ncbi:RNA-directed DNA polymerase, eukaryota, reverse transcriptase zinc-binding domain protein [Tanacetum coccineum]